MTRTPEQKEAWNAYQREYRKKNAARVRELGKEYSRMNRETDPEKIRAINLKSYYKHHDRRVAEMRERYWSNPDKYRAYFREAERQKRIKRDALAGRPKPAECESCGRAGRIVWDHCHDSGEFRGWLCHECNVSLGLMEDNPEFIAKLAAYMERHSHLKLKVSVPERNLMKVHSGVRAGDCPPPHHTL